MMTFGSLEYTIAAFEQHLKEGDATVYNTDQEVKARFGLEGEIPTLTAASEWKTERASISKEIDYYKGLVRANRVN